MKRVLKVVNVHIVNSAGQLAAEGTPRVVFGAGASMQVEAVLAVTQGAPLPGASFTASVSGDGFTADGTSIVAGDTAGESTSLWSLVLTQSAVQRL